jgi:hypothetical protein
MLTQKEIEMLLDSMTMLAILIALTTSVAVITLAIRQNAVLTKEVVRLRRELRKSRHTNYYVDLDVAKEDLWTTK